MCYCNMSIDLGSGLGSGCMMRHTDFVEMTAPLCNASMGWMGCHVLGCAHVLSHFDKFWILT